MILKVYQRVRETGFRRVEEGFRTPGWMALAYFDHSRCEAVMVIWPLHYLVQFGYWVNYRWSMYRHKPSWIDREIERQYHRRLERSIHGGRR